MALPLVGRPGHCSHLQRLAEMDRISSTLLLNELVAVRVWK